MKNTILILALAALPLTSCGSTDHPNPDADSKSAVEANVFSQDEADARATSSINAQNADAELEKLTREINGGG